MVHYLLLLVPLFLTSQSLKIASYNVENLFDMQQSGLEYSDYVPGRHNWREAILVKKLHNLAEVICDLDADVIGLQEVESDRALKRLQGVLKRVGCDYGYRAITDTKQTTIHNALLSKIPIGKKRDIVIRRTGRQRSILEVQLKSNPPLRIFVNHWRSKSAPESKRIPYAKALIKRIDSLPNGTEYIIVGDFNSNYNELQVIEQRHNDTGGIVGLNHILRTTNNNELVRYHTLTGNLHYNLWLELPSYQRWSHNFYGKKEGIDSIVIPASLHNGIGWEYQKDSFFVHKPNYLFGKYGQVKRWEYKHGKHTGKGYSDHLPICATVTTNTENISVDMATKKQRSFWQVIYSLFAFKIEKKNLLQSTHETTVIQRPVELTIRELLKQRKLLEPVKLKGIHVIFKRGDSAIIKQEQDGRAILLYRCAKKLEEGNSYDITVYKKKRYKGLDQLVDIRVDQALSSSETSPILSGFMPKMMEENHSINEVVIDIEGVYRKREIEIDGSLFPIYFKKRVKRPPHDSRIRIKRAQIGYYKTHMQLVVWDKNDYQIMEK